MALQARSAAFKKRLEEYYDRELPSKQRDMLMEKLAPVYDEWNRLPNEYVDQLHYVKHKHEALTLEDDYLRETKLLCEYCKEVTGNIEWARFLTELINIAESIKSLRALRDERKDTLPFYLNGLLQSKGVTYWEYINVDALLDLQNPRTREPDEMIFIVYHQICELYFKLILQELDQLVTQEYELKANWAKRVNRVINYFDHLARSFEILLPQGSGTDGNRKEINTFDKEEFNRFRLALLPSSGFQTAQFRKIEMISTDLINLVKRPEQPKLSNEVTKLEKRKTFREGIEAIYQHIYWKEGGLVKDEFTGELLLDENGQPVKGATLRDFEHKYDAEFKLLIEQCARTNLYQRFQQAFPDDEDVKVLLKRFDHAINQKWKKMHLAMVHLLPFLVNGMVKSFQ